MYDEITITPDNRIADIATAWDMALLEDANRALGAEAERLAERVRALSNEQIKGGDHRLTDFWAEAQRLADQAGHCEVFDELAEALGGPRRTRSGHLHVSRVVTYTVEVDDIEDYSEDDLDFDNADSIEWGDPEITDTCQD